VVQLFGNRTVVVAHPLDQGPLGDLVHSIVVGGGFEDHGDELRIAGVDDAGESLCGGEVEPLADLVGRGDRSVPVRERSVRLGKLVGRGPRAAGERLDPQRADVLLVGAGEDRFVVVLVVVLPGDDGIQGNITDSRSSIRSSASRMSPGSP